MKIEISKIGVTERIRKEINKVNELAENICTNGLIMPIAVMSVADGQFQLLAGLRRLRAMELNGETEIEANVIPAVDAEAALRIEFSENEQREPFTYSEKMDYARLIEEIEKAKAKERMSFGGQGGLPQGEDCGSYLNNIDHRGQRRDIIGEKIGMSGKQYDRAKYVANNAPLSVIDELDRGERSIRGTYDELRRKEKSDIITPENVTKRMAPELEPWQSQSAVTPRAVTTPQISQTLEHKTKPQTAPTQKELAAMAAKKDEFVAKYAAAEHKREMLETQLHNTELQWECERAGKNDEITALRTRVTELETALEVAHARIKELEDKYEQN